MSNFELIRVVDDSEKPARRGVTKITKDNNGLISIQSIEMNDNQELIERVRLTVSSVHRALVENHTQSDVALIDTIIKAMVEDAKRQAVENANIHLRNRMAEINESVAAYKQKNLEIMKQYLTPKETKPSLWDIPIDIYNMGEPIEGDGSLGGDSSTVETEIVDEEQSFDI